MDDKLRVTFIIDEKDKAMQCLKDFYAIPYLNEG